MSGIFLLWLEYFFYSVAKVGLIEMFNIGITWVLYFTVLYISHV